ncbi:hypothetical protein T07_13829 [Trichinella nelsoni]|uniref:Uncharacterized protein n=1 Tax=Trichinella nelsoni TaxID=6336 RepID=A0A0V0RUX0_9BILA|nr:hypothetical protein T07_13829 [Trichinella nelsoni]
MFSNYHKVTRLFSFSVRGDLSCRFISVGETRVSNGQTPPPVEPIIKEEPKPIVVEEAPKKMEKVPRSEDYDTIKPNLSNVFDNFQQLQAQMKDMAGQNPPVAGPVPAEPAAAAGAVADPKNKPAGNFVSKDQLEDYITVQSGNTIAFFVPTDKPQAAGAPKVEGVKDPAENDLKFKSAQERTAVEYLHSKR